MRVTATNPLWGEGHPRRSKGHPRRIRGHIHRSRGNYGTPTFDRRE